MITYNEFISEEIILEEKELFKLFAEQSREGNIGLMEMFQFLPKASDDEKKEMTALINNKDIDSAKKWEKFKELIFRVTGIELI
jgi:hypothetical protein